MVFSDIFPYLFGGGGIAAFASALFMWRKVRAESDQTTVTTAQGVLTMQMTMMTQVKAELEEERKACREERIALEADFARRMEARNNEVEALRRLTAELIARGGWQDRTDKKLETIHTQTNSTLREALEQINEVKKQNESLIKKLAETEAKREK